MIKRIEEGDSRPGLCFTTSRIWTDSRMYSSNHWNLKRNVGPLSARPLYCFCFNSSKSYAWAGQNITLFVGPFGSWCYLFINIFQSRVLLVLAAIEILKKNHDKSRAIVNLTAPLSPIALYFKCHEIFLHNAAGVSRIQTPR